MKIEISPELAKYVDTAIAFASTENLILRLKFIMLYNDVKPEELAAFCHALQEVAYGEEWVQKNAVKGMYNPENFDIKL